MAARRYEISLRVLKNISYMTCNVESSAIACSIAGTICCRKENHQHCMIEIVFSISVYRSNMRGGLENETQPSYF